jgi:hypothetical protein
VQRAIRWAGYVPGRADLRVDGTLHRREDGRLTVEVTGPRGTLAEEPAQVAARPSC